jgi:hypothetical protein
MVRQSWFVVALLTLAACACSSSPSGEGEGEGTVGEGEGEPSLLAYGTPCTSDDACSSGVCAVEAEQLGGRALCSSSCNDPFEDNQACLLNVVFTLCTVDDECSALGANGICLLGVVPDDGVCIVPLGEGGACGDDGQCPAGEQCVLNFTGTSHRWLCAPSTAIAGGQPCDDNALNRAGDLCRTAADCPAGFACNAEGANNVCVAPATAQCAGLICWEHGVCAGGCDSDAACPVGMACESFPLGANDTLVGFCRPNSGSRNDCRIDSDCPAGEACSFHNGLDGVELLACNTIAPEDGALGDPCGDDPTTGVVEDSAPCASDVCLVDGRCDEICLVNEDCPDGFGCVYFDVIEGDVIGLCQAGAGCSNDAACGAGETCIRTTSSDGGLESYCVQSRGTLVQGDDCDESLSRGASLPQVTCFEDSICEANLRGSTCGLIDHRCRAPADEICDFNCVQSRCTSVCALDSDCGDPEEWLCSGFSVVPDGSVLTTTCRWLPGSRTSCVFNDDCVAGEVCRPQFDIEGASSMVCATPLEGAGPDSPCGIIGNDVIRCDNDLCIVSEEPGVNVCTSSCNNNDDCSGNDLCRLLTVGGSGQRVQACQSNDGSGGIAG